MYSKKMAVNLQNIQWLRKGDFYIPIHGRSFYRINWSIQYRKSEKEVPPFCDVSRISTHQVVTTILSCDNLLHIFEDIKESNSGVLMVYL